MHAIKKIYRKDKDYYTILIQNLLLFMIVLIPIINFNEIVWALGLSNNASREGFYITKYIKDFGMILIVFIVLLRLFRYKKAPRSFIILPYVIVVLFLHIVLSCQQSLFTILCGIRWFFPLILFIFLYKTIDKIFFEKIARYTLFIFIIHVIFQIIESFVMPPYNGTTYFGLTGRVPGLFSHAHSGASFTCLSYLLIEKANLKNVYKSILYLLSFISIFLTMSSTGIITLILLFLLKITQKSKFFKLYFLLSPFLLIVLFLNADTLTNRSTGSSETSITIRQEILRNIIDRGNLISTDFGLSTNAAMITAASNNAIIADSFYTSLIGNLGYIPTFFAIIAITFVFYIKLKKRYFYSMNIILFYLLFSISTIITEVYPLNIFIAIFTSYILKYKN